MASAPLHSAAPAEAALAALWHGAGLPPQALAWASLPGSGQVLPSSFDVATAAQAGIGAAALAAAWWWQQRTGQAQQLQVDRRHATLECSGWFAIDGVVPPLWDKLSGLSACGGDAGTPGWVRLHCNFAHHRDAALRVLGLLGPMGGDAVERAAVEAALRGWTAPAIEQAITDAGGVAAAARSFEQWDAHPQAVALAGQPLVEISPIAGGEAAPRAWAQGAGPTRPLSGLRVLDLTRILAGPVAGRTLAAHGAEVLLINGPQLPNIAAIADTSRGKRSAWIDLGTAAGRDRLQQLAHGAHVFLQGYRPGALAAHGFGAEELARRHPGIVVASLSAYGETGPWAGRRGFDSLVQTASGLNLAEAQAAGSATPRAQPVQILDYSAGHLLAFGIQAALWRQATLGGSWQVRVTLAGVAAWLRGMGQDRAGLAVATAPIEAALAPWLADFASGFGAPGQPGTLRALRHAAQLSATPPCWPLPAMPPGSHAPHWLADGSALAAPPAA